MLTLGNVLCFLAGYYVRSGRSFHDEVSAVTKMAGTIRARKGGVGVVTRPSAAKVRLWTKPKEEEEQEAFKRSFQEQTGREHP